MKQSIGVTAALLLGAISVCSQRPAAPKNSNPFLSDSKAVAEGQVTYNGTCTACHGRDGAAGDRAPALGAPGRKYLRNSDDELFDAIRSGIPGTDMPPSGLSETDAWKVAAYIRGLRGTAIDLPVKGDPVKGEQIYQGKGGCTECHMIRGKGGLIGPDLSNLASVRKLVSIENALTKAQHRVETDGGRHDTALEPLDRFQVVNIVTNDGRKVRGVLKNANSFSLQVLGVDNTLHVFDRAKVRELSIEPKSLMPTDYDKRLTPEEFQNLLAFLSRLGTAGGQ